MLHLYFAYLDPGTGSIVIQAVLGAVLGIIVVMRNQIIVLAGKVKSLFSGKTKSESPVDE